MKTNIFSKRLVIFAAVAFLFLGAASIVNAEGTLLYEQEWYDGGTAATTAVDNANDVDYEAADNFYNLSSSIDTVVIYGLTLFHDGSDWVEMTPDATEPFIVRFYADNGSDPGIEATTTGTYQLCLEDSYGDGWNGGLVSVFVDGNLVLEEITLASGTGPECHDFTANAGEYITTVYVPDEYPGENYYCIKDPSDTIIVEEGVGDETPTSIGGPNEPDWDNPVAEQAVTADVSFVTTVWSDSYNLSKFNMTLNEDVDLEDGWISAQIDADNGSGTWFLWMNSLDGDLTSYQRVPAAALGRGSDNTKITSDTATLDVNGFDLAMELWDITPNSPVTNVDTGEGFDTIQAAIDDNDTLDGHTIEVSDGTYPEGTLVVNKSLTLLGPNAGLDGTDTSRDAEAIIHYPTNMTADTAGSWAPVIWVNASDVTIDGFKVTDGEADSSVNFSYFTGITNDYTSGICNNMKITNNIVDGDFNYISVLISAYGIGGDHLTGTEVSNNLCMGNHGLYHTIYLQDAAGTVTGNTVENCAAALQIQPYDNPNSGTVTNNDFSGYVNGIYYNYAMNGAGTWLVEENDISRAAAPTGSKSFDQPNDGILGISAIDDSHSRTGRNWSGLYLRTHGTSGTGSSPDVDFNNNVINGSGANDPYWDEIRAVQIRNIDDISLATFYGNEIINADAGVYVYSDADVDNVEFHHNNFIDNTEGIENTNTFELDATCNWWNDITGPSGQGSGSGESVSLNVDFVPWLIDAYPVGECMGYPGPVTNIDTEEQFTTIQAAIDDADTLAGHTILANAGTYSEDVLINKDLTVMGISAVDVIIDGKVNINADGVTLKKFTVAPTTVYSGNEAGVTIGANDVIVEDNIIDGVTGDGTGWFTIKGIHVYGGTMQISNILIQNNEIKNIHNQDDADPSHYGGADGIMVQGNCSGVDVIGNTITEVHSAGWAYGMSVTPTNIPPNYPAPQNVLITENTIDTVNDGSVYTQVYDGVAFSLDETSGGADDGDASQVTLEYNNFINTAYGAVNKDTSDALFAECNWWGDATGPYNATENPSGNGAEIIGNISFLPWLDDLYPYGTCSGGLEQPDINQSVFDRGFPIRHAVDGDWAGAQNFTPTLSAITKVEVYIRAFGTPEFDLTVELRENDPEGTLLDSITVPAGDVPTSWTWFAVDFDDITVASGTDYFIVMPPAPSGVATSFGYEWGYAFGDQYPDGSFWFTRDGGVLWRDLPTMYEFVFSTFGY